MLIFPDPFQFALALLLIYAACVDIIRFQISNRIVLICAALFFVAALFTPGSVNWLSHLAASALMLAISLWLININFMGGGDLKLLSALCLWTGLSNMLTFLVAVAIAGGILSLLLLLARYAIARMEIENPDRIPRALQKDGPVPYGVAIAAGTIFLMVVG